MDATLRALERDFMMSPSREMLLRMGSALNRAGDATLGAWLQFLSGHWTMDAPTKEGSYFTKTLQHELAGQIHVMMIEGQLVVPTVTMRISPPSERWGAYWWSEPMPHMPVHTDHSSEQA